MTTDHEVAAPPQRENGRCQTRTEPLRSKSEMEVWKNADGRARKAQQTLCARKSDDKPTDEMSMLAAKRTPMDARRRPA